MATARRSAPQEEPAAEVQKYDHGFTAEDLTLPRMRVVGKDADLVTAGVAKPADIAIGNSSDDEESTVYPAPGGVKFFVLTWRANYACGFNGPKGQWDEGDPEMPADAKKQYHYTLCVPGFDSILPVLYTANGTAAREFRKVNTALAQAGMSGKGPHEVAFELSSKMFSANINNQTKTWPGPVIKRAQPTDEELQIAAAMYESIVGPGRAQIESGSVSGADDAPGF